MASAIQATLTSKLDIVETISQAAATDPTLTYNSLNESVTLNGTTTPPVTKRAVFSKALAAGAGTIDLTALPGITADETVVGTGLSVQFAKFQNPSTNANAITIAKGASNGYTGFGSAFSHTLQPGQSIEINGAGLAAAIASGVKTLDLSGTGTQALNVMLALG